MSHVESMNTVTCMHIIRTSILFQCYSVWMLLRTVEAQRIRSAAQSVGLIDKDSVELCDFGQMLRWCTLCSQRGVCFVFLWVLPVSECDKEQLSKMVTDEVRINTKTFKQA